MSSEPRVEWDDAKNAENRRTHGFGFAEAAEVFKGPTLTDTDERPYEETSEISFGFLGTGVVAAVTHTDREGVIRIISARKATERERDHFHVYLQSALS